MSGGDPDYPKFDDGKAPDALRTIGEVAKALGIRQHVLRYWEEQFPKLSPVKRSGGRRYYRPDDIALIATIDRLVHHEGYTLRGARKALSNRRGEPAKAPVRGEPEPQAAPASPATRSGGPTQLSMFGDDLSSFTAELRGIRETLASALSSA